MSIFRISLKNIFRRIDLFRTITKKPTKFFSKKVKYQENSRINKITYYKLRKYENENIGSF